MADNNYVDHVRKNGVDYEIHDARGGGGGGDTLNGVIDQFLEIELWYDEDEETIIGRCGMESFELEKIVQFFKGTIETPKEMSIILIQLSFNGGDVGKGWVNTICRLDQCYEVDGEEGTYCISLNDESNGYITFKTKYNNEEDYWDIFDYDDSETCFGNHTGLYVHQFTHIQFCEESISQDDSTTLFYICNANGYLNKEDFGFDTFEKLVRYMTTYCPFVRAFIFHQGLGLVNLCDFVYLNDFGGEVHAFCNIYYGDSEWRQKTVRMLANMEDVEERIFAYNEQMEIA